MFSTGRKHKHNNIPLIMLTHNQIIFNQLGHTSDNTSTTVEEENAMLNAFMPPSTLVPVITTMLVLVVQLL